ncbi:hypothetical protein J3459_002507 [Metarhizium acridum]|uniref:uncharacterized protein n=1 Tax=Metarhizium acridum TaxID=92637 RepID=UPI001C6BEBAD|nr:hypothetical protein J3458_001130 [Metarhizium acridum]KAG8428708.1 hypothetical protein J3459_002507 [Metarhizium acridum]
MYENYKQYLFEQQHMSRRDYEKNMLRDALHNFPRLLGVEIILRSSREGISSGQTPKLTSLSPVAQKILAEPEARSELPHPERHFWTLLQSVCVAGHAKRLTSLCALDVDLQLWNHMAASLGDYHESPSSLQHLSLEFQVTAYSGKETTKLAALIARAASLRSLRLHSVKVDDEGPLAITPLRKVIVDAAHLQHLQSLSLKCLVTHETYLRSILRSNRETLRSLELSDMRFSSSNI